MVYLAESLALAVLETRVHLEATITAEIYVGIEILLPADQLTDILELEGDWQHDLGLTRQLGDQWLVSASTLALRVPSAIIPAGGNILLNPAHEAFGLAQETRRLNFSWDARLF